MTQNREVPTQTHPLEPTTENTTEKPEDLLKNCKVYFDGCNNCQVMPNGGLACTKKFCEVTEEPQCLEYTTTPEENIEITIGEFLYTCEDNQSFLVRFEGKGAVDATLLDLQTNETTALTQTISASGARYESTDGLVYWSKGTESTVSQGEKILYKNCQQQESL